MNIKLYESTTFKGTYRGIHFKIIRWFYESDIHQEKPKWNYYIFLNLENFVDQKLAKKFWPKDAQFSTGGSWYTPYDAVPFIHSMDFHCGVTFYQKHLYPGNRKIVEIGCDYSHLYDEGAHYNEQHILYEVENSIERFHEMVEYKIRCNGNGKLYLESEGQYRNNGFFSNEWTDKNKPKTTDENQIN